MRCRDAVKKALEAFGPEASYICANGYISREAYGIEDWPQNFYMIGSMGLAGSIALGVALAQPERKVVILDGDGNVLMGLGGLALIGSQQPKNLYHLCLDNGVYASTGNQPTIAPDVALEGMAREAGYASSSRVDDEGALEAALATMKDEAGPSFLRVMIQPEPHPRDFARVSHTPVEVRDRFQGALGVGGGA